jgi:hypothetical protein
LDRRRHACGDEISIAVTRHRQTSIADPATGQPGFVLALPIHSCRSDCGQQTAAVQKEVTFKSHLPIHIVGNAWAARLTGELGDLWAKAMATRPLFDKLSNLAARAMLTAALHRPTHDER